MGGCAVICDDDPVLRAVLGALVEEAGWVPAEADAAHAAVDLVRALRPGLVILDIALAGPSGISVLPLVREVAPDATTVVVSAFGSALELAVAAGATAVFE